VRAYGAKGDGTTDDTAAIQTTIDTLSAAGGGVAFLPPGYVYKAINLVLKSGVILYGSPGGYGYLLSNIKRAVLQASGAGTIVDTTGGATGAGVIGIDFQGLGSGTAVKGLRVRGGSAWSHFKNLHFSNFSDEAIVSDVLSMACVFEDILAINSVLNRTRAAIIGAVDIHGTDHFLNRIEASVSGNIEGTVQSANLYCIGLLIRMSSGFVSDSFGEFSDIGIYVWGDYNRIINSRSDHNYGHGLYVTGGSNQFTNFTSHDNSKHATNTYDNFYASSVSANNQYSNCQSFNAGAITYHRYGFNDQNNQAPINNKYFNVKDSSSATASFLNQSSGSIFQFGDGPSVTLVDGDTTPNVSGYTTFIQVNTDNTTITNFDGSVYGQRILLQVGGAGTTIVQHGTNIYTNTGSSKTLAPYMFYMFIKSGSSWIEQ
jgi:hypothetical protein